MSVDPSDRDIWRGVMMDVFSIAFLDEVEAELGRPIDYVYQGSYNKGVTNSAHTHDEGCALDCWDRDPDKLVRIMSHKGGAAYNRAGKGDWIDHIHVGIGGMLELMSPELEAQWHDYMNEGDGLGTLVGGDDYQKELRPDPRHGFDYAGSKSAQWSHGKVYVKDLHKGVRNSDSVSRFQWRLLHHPKVPARNVVVDGWFGDGTEHAAQYWQREIFQADAKEYRDGTEITNKQANQLFGDKFQVIEK